MTFKFPKKFPKEWIEQVERNGKLNCKIRGSQHNLLGKGGTDPNFGYETIGESKVLYAGVILYDTHSCPLGGTADSISVHCAAYSASYYGNSKCAIYNADLTLLGETEEKYIGDTTLQWRTYNFLDPKPSLNADTNYILAFWMDKYTYVSYDSGSSQYQSLDYTGNFPDTLVQTGDIYYEFSKYCTYTTGGGAVTYTKTYTADTLFQKLGITKTYTADTLFKKKDISKTYNIDTVLAKLGLTKTYTIDALLKKLGITKTYSVDALFKKLGIPKTYTIDTVFAIITAGTYTKTYTIDTLLKKLGITTSYTINTLFQKLGLTKTYTIDSHFVLRKTKTYTANALFKKSNITLTYTVDAYFGEPLLGGDSAHYYYLKKKKPQNELFTLTAELLHKIREQT